MRDEIWEELTEKMAQERAKELIPHWEKHLEGLTAIGAKMAYLKSLAENLAEKGKEFTDEPETVYAREHLIKSDWVHSKIAEFEQGGGREKMMWKGSVSQFGYIIGELVDKGFIEMPVNENYSRFADLCLELFEFKKGTTPQTLAKALNPNSNQLAESNRKYFQIPDIQQLSNKRN
jgi:hypothetical protein